MECFDKFCPSCVLFVLRFVRLTFCSSYVLSVLRFVRLTFCSSYSLQVVYASHHLKHFHFPVLFSFITYHRICNQSNTTGATSGAGTDYLSGVHPRILVGFLLLDLQFSVQWFVDCCFSFCFFIVWPLHCLSFALWLLVFLHLWYLQTFLIVYEHGCNFNVHLLTQF